MYQLNSHQIAFSCMLLGRHGSDSLCRDEREKQDGGYIQCISIQTLIFRLAMNFIRPKTLRSALWRCPILQQQGDCSKLLLK